MAELYTYAVSRIHSKESDLLSKSDIEQLISCPDFDAAIKYLTEHGYGYDRAYSDFDTLREDETEKMWGLIQELVPDTKPFETILRPIDYHNLKAAIKMVFTSETSMDYFRSGGTVNPELILDAVKHKNFSDLPKFMREAAETASAKFAKTSDGQECDLYIDKACLETMIADGINSKVEIIRDYTELYTAICNIKIAVRGAKMLKSKLFFDESLVKCKSIDIDSLAKSASKGIDEVYDYLKHTDYHEAADKLKISMSEFEKWADNLIIRLIKNQKSNPFTIQPIFSYILAKQNELKAVQIVLAGKKNELDNEFVRERIRDLYV